MHVYKNIAVHVYVLYDIYTLSRLRDFFHIYDLPMLTYTKCTYTCNFTRIWALLFLYMYNFIKSYTKYLQVYIRGLCHLYEVLLYVKKSCTYTKPKFSYTISSFRIREKVRLYEVVPLRSKITYWCVGHVMLRVMSWFCGICDIWVMLRFRGIRDTWIMLCGFVGCAIYVVVLWVV